VLGFVGGGGVALMMEFAQLFVLSRFTDVTDIALGSIGAGLGAWWMTRSLPRPADSPIIEVVGSRSRVASWWLAALGGYSLFLAAGFWFPFEWTDSRDVIRARLDGFFRVPFLALYQGTEFNAIRQVLVRLLLFVPVGAIVARTALLALSDTARRAIEVAGLAYAALLATGIEAAEIAMPSKVADATEVFVCLGGAVIGLVVMRRVLGPGAVESAAVAAEAARSRQLRDKIVWRPPR
jgi:glycopeptide antibiotics resistance protein